MREVVLPTSWLRPVAFALAGALFVGLAAHVSGVTAAAPGSLSGRAAVVDGDTLDIDGRRVRLEGIDAPEHAQTCGRPASGTWPCGTAAKRALEKLIAAQPVTCESRGLDKYDRMLGVCFVGGRDVNEAMVRSGYAWAFVKYSRSYVEAEKAARVMKAGIWQGEAEPAWAFREKRWASAEDTAPNGCAIKGNITGNGQIYHMPWSHWYGKVKVEPAKGERWFCSESEAQSAGWRPALTY